MSKKPELGDASQLPEDTASDCVTEASSTAALERALAHAKRWLGDLESRSVYPTADLETLRNGFGGSIPEKGTAPEQVIDDLVGLADDGHTGSASGRFFAWVIGGSLTSALAADWLVSTWDQNAAIYSCGPSVSVIEETAGAWVLDLLDLSRDASFAFTTGCQMAHVTSLAAARHALLKAHGWSSEDDGLFGAPKIRVLVTTHRHESIDRAVRFLGMGRNSIEQIPTSDSGHTTASLLKTALDKSDSPTIVVLKAGDLNTGAYDNFAELIPISQSENAWVHVDGAFGLFARASRSKQSLVEGIDRADSRLETDGHECRRDTKAARPRSFSRRTLLFRACIS